MEKQRQTAGETAKTKPGWGIVAVIGFIVSCTMGESLAMAAIGAAMLGLGAWKGGYMEGTTQQLRNDLTKPAKAGERRVA